MSVAHGPKGERRKPRVIQSSNPPLCSRSEEGGAGGGILPTYRGGDRRSYTRLFPLARAARRGAGVGFL